MSLELTVNEEIKTAMKAKDAAALRTLRGIKLLFSLKKRRRVVVANWQPQMNKRYW